jgi:hypothetical protein
MSKDIMTFDILFRKASNPINLDIPDIKHINLEEEYRKVDTIIPPKEAFQINDIYRKALDRTRTGDRPIQEYDIIHCRNDRKLIETLIVIDAKSNKSNILKRNVQLLHEEGDLHGLYRIPFRGNPFLEYTEVDKDELCLHRTIPKLEATTRYKDGDFIWFLLKDDSAVKNSTSPNDYHLATGAIPLVEWNHIMEMSRLTFKTETGKVRGLKTGDMAIMRTNNNQALTISRVYNKEETPFFDERMFGISKEDYRFIFARSDLEDWQQSAFLEMLD